MSIIGYEANEYQRDNILKNIDKTEEQNFTFRSGIEILTPGIDNVRVYIGDEKIGETPCELNDLNLGYHRLTLEKAGYESLSFVVYNSSDQRVVVKARLLKSSGLLTINNIPENTDLLIDGLSVSEMPITLEYGPHVILIFSDSILISESRIILQEEYMTVDFDQIYKRVSHVNLSFNSYNPQTVQDANAFTLESDLVSEIRVKLIKNDVLVEETVWTQPENGPVPLIELFKDLGNFEDGLYHILCLSNDQIIGELEFYIDRTSSRLPRSLNSGTGGLLLCPLPDTLPAYTGEFRTTIAPLIYLKNNDFLLDSGFGVRYAFPKNWEVHLSALIQYSMDLNDMAFGPQLSVKKKIIWNDGLFSMAVGVSGGYWAPVADYGSYNYQYGLLEVNGFSIFAPMIFGNGSWNLSFSPQLNLYTVNDPIDGDDSDAFSGFSINSALNLGFEWILPLFSLGFSGRIKSPMFTNSQTDMWTFDLAVETCLRFTSSVAVEVGVLYGYNYGNMYIGGLIGMSFIP